MQEKRRESHSAGAQRARPCGKPVTTRGLINGTAISNGMLSWKVSHREPPALPLTDSQERKEEGREEGRRGQEGRKRGQAFCPDPCQFPFANDSGKGVMIFHSEEICQVSGNTTRTGDDNGPKANAFRYFCPPTPPSPPHSAERGSILYCNHHHRRLNPLSNTTADARRHLRWSEINEEPPNFIKNTYL